MQHRVVVEEQHILTVPTEVNAQLRHPLDRFSHDLGVHDFAVTTHHRLIGDITRVVPPAAILRCQHTQLVSLHYGLP